MESREINEVINLIIANCYIQTKTDVAIPYICGKPGGGKTTIINTKCKELGWGLISTHFALKPIEETGGIPQFEKIKINGKEIIGTTWSFPDIMKELYKTSEQKEMVIWFLDDMHLCGPVHMAMLYELLTERKLREYKIPENCSLVLAGNHMSNKAGAKTMFSAIVNRVFMMPVHTSFEGWKENYAIKNNIEPEIISFLNNDRYKQFFHEEEIIDEPWGSPRSWTRLSNIISELKKMNAKMEYDDIYYISSGHVGKTAASEFTIYYDMYSKFNIKKIINDADNFEIPNDNLNRYIIAYMVADFVINSEINNYVDKICKIVSKYANNAPELCMLIFSEIFSYEKITKKKRSIKIIEHLNKTNPEIVRKFISEITNV